MSRRITVTVPDRLYKQYRKVAYQMHISCSRVILLKLLSTKGIPRCKLNKVKSQSLYAVNQFNDIKFILKMYGKFSKNNNNDAINYIKKSLKELEKIRKEMQKL